MLKKSLIFRYLGEIFRSRWGNIQSSPRPVKRCSGSESQSPGRLATCCGIMTERIRLSRTLNIYAQLGQNPRCKLVLSEVGKPKLSGDSSGAAPLRKVVRADLEEEGTSGGTSTSIKNLAQGHRKSTTRPHGARNLRLRGTTSCERSSL